MIAPRQEPIAPVEEPLRIREAVDAFFRPGGRLQQACVGAPFPFEPRPQQREMAAAVAAALEGPQHLAVEAGTGVGKSYAYLVPLILAAAARKAQVVVSTYTIALQEQLMYKDIPFLQAHLGVDFRAVLVKGRSNYLCRRRLALALRNSGQLFRTAEQDELNRIRAWADQTAEGSLQDLAEQPPADVWGAVCAERGNCDGVRCRHYRACFLTRARAQMRTANLLVVNHYLLFSELKLRAQGAAFLPNYTSLVLDEAHMVEGVATDHLGMRISHYMFEYWLRRLYTPDTGKGLLKLIRHGEAANEVTRAWEEAERFFGLVRDWAAFTTEETQRVVAAPLDLPTNLPQQIGRVTAVLRRIVDGLGEQEEIRAELNSARQLGAEMKDELEAFLEQSWPDQVYWVESEGKRRQQTVLYSAPIEVGPMLAKSLFERIPCVIMTSATLAVAGSLDYFRGRVGAERCATLCLGSPFNFSRQMRIYIARDMPDPNDAAAFPAAAARGVRFFVNKTRGRAFVLFTSARLMRQVADAVRDDFERQGLAVYVQGAGLGRHAMLEKFKAGASAVLFGLDSFWMGVDVRGEALSNVIICRLPFAVPDQPVVKARMDRIKSRGGEPFKEYSLPEAILKFRQGVGRLIRTATDEGIIAILDSRILNKYYGRKFLASIPECPVEIVEV